MRPHVIFKYILSFCKRKGDDDLELCFYFHDLQVGSINYNSLGKYLCGLLLSLRHFSL